MDNDMIKIVWIINESTENMDRMEGENEFPGNATALDVLRIILNFHYLDGI